MFKVSDFPEGDKGENESKWRVLVSKRTMKVTSSHDQHIQQEMKQPTYSVLQ